ncbi:MAG: hypothetical protein VXU42_04840, partial [Verrucomicrobiota bacterium]|nr:hypothetical protein [Verrucomicrobiota bacterium]
NYHYPHPKFSRTQVAKRMHQRARAGEEGSDAWCAGRTCSPDRIKSNGGPVAIELQMHKLCKL